MNDSDSVPLDDSDPSLPSLDDLLVPLDDYLLPLDDLSLDEELPLPVNFLFFGRQWLSGCY